MVLLKQTEEYRVETEADAIEAIDRIRAEALENGYAIGAIGYTHKEKKMKGEIIDSCEVLKVVKIFGGVWG